MPVEKLGKITINEVHIYELNKNPSTDGGFDAPLGSLALIKIVDPRIYQKVGPALTDWKIPIGFQSFFNVENTDITTNINLNTNPEFETQIPITGNIVIDSSDYTVVGNLIRCNFNGTVIATSTIDLVSANSNANVFLKLGKNLTTFFGNLNSFEQAFANRPTLLTGVIDVSVNDTLGIFSERQANAGTITMNGVGTSRINLVRV